MDVNEGDNVAEFDWINEYFQRLHHQLRAVLNPLPRYRQTTLHKYFLPTYHDGSESQSPDFPIYSTDQLDTFSDEDEDKDAASFL